MVTGFVNARVKKEKERRGKKIMDTPKWIMRKVDGMGTCLLTYALFVEESLWLVGFQQICTKIRVDEDE